MLGSNQILCISIGVMVLSLGGCAALTNQAPVSDSQSAIETAPSVEPAPHAEPEPVVQIVRDPELERRVTQLELQLMERDARIESQGNRLELALGEVVGVMRKLRSVATRAEAASAMAETDVALQSIGNPGHSSREVDQATRLMQQSSEEFKRKNYGGALFLANQAKAAVRLYGLGGGKGELRSGEVIFAAPVKLRASTRANVRIGPGTSFKVSFITDADNVLSGLSYVEEWIRVIDEDGKEGWIHATLVARRKDTTSR